MMFAQFYHRAVGSPELIEAVGDRAVIVIDGRLTKPTIARIANAVCVDRGYLAWRIHAGDTFTRSRPVSDIHLAQGAQA